MYVFILIYASLIIFLTIVTGILLFKQAFNSYYKNPLHSLIFSGMGAMSFVTTIFMFYASTLI